MNLDFFHGNLTDKKSEFGFTLVELSISLIIIGIMVAGLVTGDALINSARMKNVIKDVNSYRSAAITFQDTYGALPGDLKDPSNALPGCTSIAICEPAGGNDDGAIGAPRISNWSTNDQSAVNTEATHFGYSYRSMD